MVERNRTRRRVVTAIATAGASLVFGSQALAEKSYLPLLCRGLNTAEATPVPIAEDLLTNGAFEEGAKDWVQFSLVTTSPELIKSGVGYLGSWAAEFTGTQGLEWVMQMAAIPAWASAVHFEYLVKRVQILATPGTTTFRSEVLDAQQERVNVRFDEVAVDGLWKGYRSRDLSAHAGKVLFLRFRSERWASMEAYYTVDNVLCLVTC